MIIYQQSLHFTNNFLNLDIFKFIIPVDKHKIESSEESKYKYLEEDIAIYGDTRMILYVNVERTKQVTTPIN